MEEELTEKDLDQAIDMITQLKENKKYRYFHLPCKKHAMFPDMELPEGKKRQEKCFLC